MSTRTWLGPEYWANRLQDWQLRDGRIECLAGSEIDQGRTVALLTREIVNGAGGLTLRVRTGVLETSSGGGFSGFLIGVGGGDLDYRASAIAQKASGLGGGFWCCYETDGAIRFREHSDEEAPLAYAVLPSTNEEGPKPARRLEEDVELALTITPRGGRYRATLSAYDGNTLLASATRANVPENLILGGIALASSPNPAGGTARFWFSDLSTSGAKLAVRDERAFGPIAGTLYSLNEDVLKLSAQLMPVGDDDSGEVTLRLREPGGRWQPAGTAALEPGYTALFRITDWDSSRTWEYEVAYNGSTYSGVVKSDPKEAGSFNIAHMSCVLPISRTTEGGVGRAELPEAELLGRYTKKNIYHPHRELIRHMKSHDPALLVFAGDQIYEHRPTRTDRSESPTLDYLYKWYLWVWAFRELTRDIPAILQTDDHDVYHGNLWGNGGRAAPKKIVNDGGRAIALRDQNRGGYRCSAEFVNLVERTQTSHNPDAFDPAPVEQGIGVYFGAFKYGGIGFAMLEDRKFKTAPIQGADLDVHEAQLLGPRQEAFLEAWAKDDEGIDARIALSQTTYGCLQTSPNGKALLDWDSNGHPKLQRDRAIELLREAGALVLAGDQHLASVVRHGLDTYTDGVVQYTGPAGGSFWQRWFEPADPADHGDFKDAFGNKMRVFAVANPKITFEYYRRFKRGRSQALGDRNLKSEGYGIIRIDRTARKFVIECWPWAVDPQAPGAQQFEGWPFTLKFDECDGRNLD